MEATIYYRIPQVQEEWKIYMKITDIPFDRLSQLMNMLREKHAKTDCKENCFMIRVTKDDGSL